MKIGFYYFATEYSMPIVEAARALEERGYESLFVPEHTHIPASRRTPWPGGAELPRQYSHTLDPFVALAAAAAATKTLRLGTGICLLTERDPIVTAKAVATLDLISGGRFEFGIGAGWNAEEMANHGTEFETRFRVMVERAKAMQAIWTQDEAGYEGEFIEFEPIWSWPKPVQKPHPPILLGGETKYTLRGSWSSATAGSRAGGGSTTPRPRCAAAKRRRGGRARHQDRVHDAVRRQPEAGYVEQCRAAGLDRALFGLPPEGRDTILRCSTSTPSSPVTRALAARRDDALFEAVVERIDPHQPLGSRSGGSRAQMSSRRPRSQCRSRNRAIRAPSTGTPAMNRWFAGSPQGSSIWRQDTSTLTACSASAAPYAAGGNVPRKRQAAMAISAAPSR